MNQALDVGELFLADGTYADGNGWSMTPNGLNDFEQYQYSLGRARHEGINRVFKTYFSLRNMWRHEREKHSIAFHALAVIVQLGLRQGDHTFTIDYDEAEFGEF